MFFDFFIKRYSRLHSKFKRCKMFMWLAIALTQFSTDAMACFAINIPLAERYAAAQNIYVGYVTGSHYYQFEQNLKQDSLSVTELPEPYALRVLVKEVIKGANKDMILHPQILNCGSGKAELKDKVIVFYDGTFWYTQVFTDEHYKQLQAMK